MKLLTEMCRDDNGEMYANDPDPYQTKGAVARDAACAHALMQAMDEAGDVVFYADDDYKRWVYDRADAIMAGWGFDSGGCAMKQSESLFYDVVNAKGVAVHFKMLGHNRALASHKMYTVAFPEAGPYRIVLTKPQPPTDRRTPEQPE